MDHLNSSYFLENMKNNSPIDNLLNQSQINRSGNSDVDVTVEVEIDTTPIAFAMLYSLLTSKQMSTEEFELAIQRLKSLNNRRQPFHYGRGINNTDKARFFYPRDSK
ncbi:hypothetical protein BEH_25115 (plasmid) [Priestia filamentosa]|uniref:Uncharacterized protein n=1 Tax=Priestia filamentosa TaxID=1402861 RepID=A0A2S1LZM4_9BACI|nr:hypothetical protein [Priestia filamentosa]AWG44270.1 hypothetical protein BEH_25115 [Priestia filamentosa]